MLRIFGYKISLKSYINKKLRQSKLLRDFSHSPEWIVFVVFCLLFFILFLRLFLVQIVNHKKYDDVLNNQHVSQSLLEADRWTIYAYDKS